MMLRITFCTFDASVRSHLKLSAAMKMVKSAGSERVKAVVFEESLRLFSSGLARFTGVLVLSFRSALFSTSLLALDVMV